MRALLINPYQTYPPIPPVEFYIETESDIGFLGYRDGVAGTLTGDINLQLPGAGQVLTLLRFTNISPAFTQIDVWIQGADSLPAADVFTSLAFDDLDGDPRLLLAAGAALTSDQGSNTRSWSWTGETQAFDELERYDLVFTE